MVQQKALGSLGLRLRPSPQAPLRLPIGVPFRPYCGLSAGICATGTTITPFGEVSFGPITFGKSWSHSSILGRAHKAGCAPWIWRSQGVPGLTQLLIHRLGVGSGGVKRIVFGPLDPEGGIPDGKRVHRLFEAGAHANRGLDGSQRPSAAAETAHRA